MFTVILNRGLHYSAIIKTDQSETRARSRADALLELHGLKTSKLTYDATARTFSVDASSYYED